MRKEGVVARQAGHGHRLVEIAVIVADPRQAIGQQLAGHQLQTVALGALGLQADDQTVAQVYAVGPQAETRIPANLFKTDDIAHRGVGRSQIGAPLVVVDQRIVFGLVAIGLVDETRHGLQRRVPLGLGGGGDPVAPLDQPRLVLIVLIGIEHVPQGIDARVTRHMQGPFAGIIDLLRIIGEILRRHQVVDRLQLGMAIGSRMDDARRRIGGGGVSADKGRAQPQCGSRHQAAQASFAAFQSTLCGQSAASLIHHLAPEDHEDLRNRLNGEISGIQRPIGL